MGKRPSDDEAYELTSLEANPPAEHEVGYWNPEFALLDVCLQQAMTAEHYSLLEQALPALTIVLVPGQDWLVPMDAFCKKAFRRATAKVLGPLERDVSKIILEAVRSYSAGRNVILITDMPERVSKGLRAVATVVEISPPSPTSFRRLARLSFAGRMASRTSLDLSSLSLTEMLAAMPVGSPVATVVSSLKALLASKVSDADGSNAPALNQTTGSEAALWGLQLVQDLDDYRAGRLQWQDVDRGGVLAGPPGTGKTLLVHSIASAAKIPLVKCSIIELFAGDGYLHTTIANIKRAFADAARLRPCILFFDELDSLPRRSSSGRGRNDDYWSALTAAFLLLLDDGTSRREGVVVIGATNRPDVLDPALLRPGRFERMIEVVPPNEQGRERALRHHLKGDLADADLSNVVKLTTGMTPADLMDLVRIAKRKARHLGRPLEHGDLSKSLELRSLTDERQRRVAIHEAGHGIIARSLSELRLLDISLIVADGKLGSARFEAKTDCRDGMEALATALLGGMAAEMEVFGDIGSGAGIGESSDLARATSLLTAVHATLGMAENLVWRGVGKGASELLNSDPDLRAAVQSDLRRVLGRARDLIRSNIDVVHRVADALVEQLVMNNDDITAIIESSGGSSGLQP